MAKAKGKGKSKGKREPQPAARGMFLTIHINDNREYESEAQISGFQDIVRIGHQVARAVKDYLRSIPMERHATAWLLHVLPEWTETAPARRRRPEMEGVPGAVERGED